MIAAIALAAPANAEKKHHRHTDDAPDTAGSLTEDDRVLVVTRARLELSRVTKYAGQWVKTSGYPMGDIPANRGACTDLVVRSLRAAGVDLQRLVHEDIEADPVAYGVDRSDPQIDHRRATILLTYFHRHTIMLPTEVGDGKSFLPGDVVFFGGASKAHVAVVSDRKNGVGIPLIIENGGPLPDETEALASRVVLGHFRIGGKSALNVSVKVNVPKVPAKAAAKDDDDDISAQVERAVADRTTTRSKKKAPMPEPKTEEPPPTPKPAKKTVATQEVIDGLLAQ